MSYRVAAGGILVLHLAFIAFVVLGAALAWRWRWMVWLHLPAAAWGTWVELAGVVCPLTAVENALLAKAGAAGYREGFVAHYLLAAIYPAGLTRDVQYVLAAFVVAVNLALYSRLLRRRKRDDTHECRSRDRDDPPR
ncbi:MAG: DUF2784 domain-containing protein [Casimicrobiaceae bacterium]